MRDHMILAALTVISHISSLGVAVGHDLAGIVAEKEQLDDSTREQVEEVERLLEIMSSRVSTEAGLEGVVERGLVWEESSVSVCFMDGAPGAWEQVVAAAQMWTEGTSLSFDFGDKGNRRKCSTAPGEIRVSFSAPGYWSYVGTVARLIPLDKPTLNLNGMGSGAKLSETQIGTVLHEFGHAIGFQHEHQSPASGCDAEFNWAYLYSALGWPKDKVDRNMKQISKPSTKLGLLVTDFDSDSIMLYALNKGAFLDYRSANCFISRKNNLLSDLDKIAAQSVYPPSSADAPEQGESVAPDPLSDVAQTWILRLSDMLK